MKLAIVTLAAAVLMFTACEDPSASSPKATTADPVAATSPQSEPPTARGEALKLTPENSKVSFVGSKVTGKHDGGFNDFVGMIDLVNERPEESSVRVEIDMKSVWTDNPTVTEHLQTADFFDVEKFPFAVFSSTAIKPGSDDGLYDVTGDLDLHGVRRSVTFPARIAVTPEAVTVDADFSINRREFGIDYAGPTNDLIRDGVAIKLNLNSSRSK
ncbi:MAG TPA: YceI family protein [Pyrinomonadaceae bacterium]|nr:YceI family protein [Pyrinomonadaceae bacterium]